MDDLFTDEGLSGEAVDLSDYTVRRELGPAAWKSFRRLMERWKISPANACRLVALGSGTNLHRVAPEQLGEEQLQRIGILIGIYKALHMLLNSPLADQWITRPNGNTLFDGRTPIAYMIEGGITALRNVRKLLNARCAGNAG